MTDAQRTEQLKDRQDYRTALINKREDLERKIKNVEVQIGKLKNDTPKT